jgi:hypothetical protein
MSVRCDPRFNPVLSSPHSRSCQPRTDDPCRERTLAVVLTSCAMAEGVDTGRRLTQLRAGPRQGLRPDWANCPGDFTILIDGGIGPQPHPSLINLSDPPTLRGGSWEVAGAGKDGTKVTLTRGTLGGINRFEVRRLWGAEASAKTGRYVAGLLVLVNGPNLCKSR